MSGQILQRKNLIAVPGTRSFHEYILLGENTVGAKRRSEYEQMTLTHNLTKKITAIDISVSDHVSCMYEKKWWLGVAMEVDKEENDVLVNFMHPAGPARSFHWPAIEDQCYVPLTHILRKIDSPVTASGRQYYINSKEMSEVKKAFISFNG